MSDIASRIKAPSGATIRYVGRLKDAARRREDGLYELSNRPLALWLRWRRPGGTVVPMSVVGSETELAVAEALSAMGFDLVYQSRVSRGAFDLLATRGAAQLGIQVKRFALRLRFSRTAWARMRAEATRLGWSWIVTAVDAKGEIAPLDPSRARIGKEVRVDASAAVENLLLWLDQKEAEAE